MRLVSKELDPARWRPIGLRVHPEVHRKLKVSAALAGETMEDHLHQILVRQLGQPDTPPMADRGQSVAAH